MNKRLPFPPVTLAAMALLATLWGPSIVLAQRAGASSASTPSRLVSIGRLIRSGQARNGTPRFALLDDRGTLTAYVVPATGVSLARHLNQEVAITARNVSRDGDGLPYLLAERVAPVTAASAQADVPARPGARDEAVGAVADEPRIVTDFDSDLDDAAVSFATDLEGDEFEDEFADDLAWGAGVARDRERVVRDRRVRPAARYVTEEIESELEELLPQPADEMILDDYPQHTTGCGNPNCASCAPCGPCVNSCCPCGPAGRFWFRAEYLGWWTKSMDSPPLVTTSPAGTAAQDAGVLGVDGTEVISGGDRSDAVSRNGVRFVLGGWMDPCQRRGIEVDYYFLDEETESFSHHSIGEPILARPFFNTQLNLQDSELVAYPGIVSGTVAVDYRSKFQSLAPRFRQNLRCDSFYPASCGGCGHCGSCSSGPPGPYGGSRVDFTIGYRYIKLEEGLQVSEDLISEAQSTFATFNLYDAFETSNEFNGVELGLQWDTYRGRWSMEFGGRFALGNNTRKVAINGGTTSVIQGAIFNDPGGLLALPSNMGTYSDDEFVVIPEFALTLGYQIAPRVRFLVGYSLIYWSNVVRPGDQIDLNVNPDLLPPAMDNPGMLSPTFAMNDSAFWAQGINLGLDWRW